MEIRKTFPKVEKLKAKKSIELLFSKGKSINAFPVRAIYLPKKEGDGVLINAGVSVPKKKIRLAVNRNLLKRRIREAYRLNNHELKECLQKTEKEFNLMFIYTSKQISSFKEIEDKIKVILTRLTELNDGVDK